MSPITKHSRALPGMFSSLHELLSRHSTLLSYTDCWGHRGVRCHPLNHRLVNAPADETFSFILFRLRLDTQRILSLALKPPLGTVRRVLRAVFEYDITLSRRVTFRQTSTCQPMM
jgi:hypothetical protein